MLSCPAVQRSAGRRCLERLRHIREQAGYSQQDLADESGVSQHTISEIELGRRKAQGRTLRKLALVLGVEVRDFFKVAHPLVQAPLRLRITAPYSKRWASRASKSSRG